MVTLGVDYGASNVGLALVRTDEMGQNMPLFFSKALLVRELAKYGHSLMKGYVWQ